MRVTTGIGSRTARQALALGLALAGLSSCAYQAALPSRPHRPHGPATYYLSPRGDNSAAGTSPATAWRSLGRANETVFVPGTRLLLQGGANFAGQLRLTAEDAGSAQRPVLVGAYGRGQATITTTSGSAIAITNTAGVDIRGLIIRGGAQSRRTGSGVIAFSNLTSIGKLHHLTISDVDISGFAYGITIGSNNDETGFSDVGIQDAALHDNTIAGLVTYGAQFNPASPDYANENVNVSHVSVYRNFGTPLIKTYSSGNGVVLGSVRNGTVSYSTAYNNGGLGGSKPGPEGIWAYDSTDVTISHSLAYGTGTKNKNDGNGFGLDQNTSNSVLEYDLSYGNQGSGYLLYSPKGTDSSRGNTVRFSIASGNAIDGNHSFGGISVLGTEADVNVYQNTIVQRSPPHQYDLVVASEVRGLRVSNNIFVNRSGAVIVARSAVGPSVVRLQGNDYFSADTPTSFQWGAKDYIGMSAWQAATGQETISGRSVGMTVDPKFPASVFRLPQGPAATLTLGSRFVPGHGSAVFNHGLNLARLFGTPPGQTNFFGAAISNTHPNIGAQ